MAKPYTVMLPGGGSKTVNANSPDAARQNAGVDGTATVVAGGHQTTTSNGTTSINPNAHVGAGEVGRAPNAMNGSTLANPFSYGSDGFSPTHQSVTTPFFDYVNKLMSPARQTAVAAPPDWFGQAHPSAYNFGQSGNPFAGSPYAAWNSGQIDRTSQGLGGF